jgi:nucleotide-binding universal stress UspA family protein
MLKIMVPVDGSENSSKAVQFVIDSISLYKEPPEIHLLTVQHPITSGNVKHFIGHEELERYYQDNGSAALRPAVDLLNRAGIVYSAHTAIGEIAQTVVRYVEDNGCQQIVLGSRGLGTVSGMLMGSVAIKVIHLSKVPVVLVKGNT